MIVFLPEKFKLVLLLFLSSSLLGFALLLVDHILLGDIRLGKVYLVQRNHVGMVSDLVVEEEDQE